MSLVLPPLHSLDVPGGLATWEGISTQLFTSWVACLAASKIVLTREGSRTSDVRETSSSGDNSASTAFFGYHYDGAYLKDQPDYCGLYCVTPGRGDSPTAFLRAADLLTKVVTASAPLEVLRKIDWVYVDRWRKSVRQPLVQDHPRTGEPLLRCSVGVGTLRWADTSEDLSSPLLRQVWSQISDAAQELRPIVHPWRRGDFAWWDNRMFLHARLAHERDAQRHLKRVWARTT